MEIAATTALALTLAATAQAQVGGFSHEPDVIMDVSGNPETCNERVASKANLEELARNPERWIGRCVAVTGLWSGRALFATRYSARVRYPQSDETLVERRLGLYGLEKIADGYPDSPSRYVAVGVAGSCERLWQGSLMVMGYCHYTGGAYLAVATMRALWR
jgi:hypothetical protein